MEPIRIRSRLNLMPAWRSDSDGDGLPDDIEFALGSSPESIDSDGDGLSDFDAVSRGLDPIGGRSTSLGVVSGVQLMGSAQAAVTTSTADSPDTHIAFVATGDAGLAVIDMSDPFVPIVLNQVLLEGQNRDIAYDPVRQLVAIAGGDAGLHLVDVSDPGAPQLIETLALGPAVNAVEIFGGGAFVAAGAGIVRVDLGLGAIIETVGNTAVIDDLVGQGNLLFATDTNRQLHSFAIGSNQISTLDTLTLPAAGGRLGISDALLLVPAADRFFGGMSSVNIEDPNNLVLLSGPDNENPFTLAGSGVAANGSGRALLVGLAEGGNAAPDTPVLDILDISTPSETDEVTGRVELMGQPGSVVISGGLALIPSGDAGLFIVNFLGPDLANIDPGVQLDLSVEDAQPEVDGIQVSEQSVLQAFARADDDIQVRRVNLLADGLVVASDLSAPFDLTFAAPVFASGGDNTLTLRARVQDTGGNVAFSGSIDVTIVPDQVGPELLRVSPGDAELVQPGNVVVDLLFDEPLDLTTVTSDSIQLRDEADAPVPADLVQLLAVDRHVRLSFANLPAGSYRVVIDADVIADRSGNVADGGLTVVSFTAVEGSIFWVNPTGGAWNDPANWDLGRVPNIIDDVVISVPGNVTVTNTHGGLANSILSNETVVIDGTFALGDRADFLAGLQFEQFGFIDGDGEVVVSGSSRFKGGSIGPDWLLTNRGTIEINPGELGFVPIFSQLINEGTVIHELGQVSMSGRGDSILNADTAVWEMRGGQLSRSGLGATFVNHGTLRYAGNESATMRGEFEHDQALIEVLSGELQLLADGKNGNNDSTYRVSAGATLRLGSGSAGALHQFTDGLTTFEGDGRVEVVDTFLDIAQSAQVELNLNGEGVTLDDVTIRGAGSVESSGSLEWIRGTIENAAFVNTGALQIVSNATHQVLTLINRGIVTQQGPVAGRGSAPLIDNQVSGTYLITTPSDITGFASSIFRNEGLFRHSADGTSEIQWGFDNEGGTVEIVAGTLSTANAEYVQTSGQTQLLGGHLAASLRGVDIQGGVLSGSGVISGNLTNAGTIAVGGVGTAGRLEITGDFTQLDIGFLQIDLGGTDPSEYDRLLTNTASESSQTTLDGTLEIALIDPFLAEGGEIFEILFFANRTGTFSVINGLTLPNDVQLSEFYDLEKLLLQA